MLPGWCCSFTPTGCMAPMLASQLRTLHPHVACLQVETGVGSFKRSSKFLQQPIFNLYQVGAALCISSFHHARRQMYTAAAVDK